MKAKNPAQNRSCLFVLEEARKKSQGPHNLDSKPVVAEMGGLVEVVEEDPALSKDPWQHDGHVEANDEEVEEGVLYQIPGIVSFVDLA
jgi:hypothetical protein